MVGSQRSDDAHFDEEGLPYRECVICAMTEAEPYFAPRAARDVSTSFQQKPEFGFREP